MYGNVAKIYDTDIGIRVFANGPGDLGSIPGWVIPKTQKMVLNASLFNTQQYKVPINDPYVTLKGSTIPNQGGTGSNGFESILHIPLSTRNGASQLDTVLCHIQNILFTGGSYLSAKDVVDIFLVPSTRPTSVLVETFAHTK